MTWRFALAAVGAFLLGAGSAAVALYATDDSRSGESSNGGPTSTVDATSSAADDSTQATADGDQSERRQAVAALADEGYDALEPKAYRSGELLNVLIGLNSESPTGTSQQAFFFVNGEYIGTDTAQPSAGIDIAYQDGDEVALSYRLYNASDAQCCPTAGSETVRYRWTGDELKPLDPIPPEDFSVDGSRR